MNEPRPALTRRSFLGGIAAAMAVAALPALPVERTLNIKHDGIVRVGGTFTIAGVHRWDVLWGARELQTFTVVSQSGSGFKVHQA